MQQVNSIALLLGLLLLSNCRSVNVVFPNRTETRNDAITVFYDKDGSLYPIESVRLDNTVMNGKAEPLREVFERQVENRGIAKVFPEWTGVSTILNNSDNHWGDVQEELIQQKVVEIKEKLLIAGDGAHLVILIHGFNSTKEQSDQWYASVMDTVRNRYEDRPYMFLNVYWDGLEAQTVPLMWSKAQHNFPLVGLEFRRLLNRLDSSIPVRVLTHSSGGPLFMSTLGNASGAFDVENDKRSPQFERYMRIQNLEAEWSELGYEPPRFDDFRVGMIVPAAAYSSFNHFKEPYTPNFELIAGINRGDFAVAKFVFPCNWGGGTCLGTKEEYWRTAKDSLRKNVGLEVNIVDLHNSDCNTRHFTFWDKHGMAFYLKRSKTKTLLDALFEM